MNLTLLVRELLKNFFEMNQNVFLHTRLISRSCQNHLNGRQRGVCESKSLKK